MGGGGGGEGRTQENFFQPFGPQFGLKIVGGPSPGSATVTCKCVNGILHEDFAVSLQKDMPFT